MPRESVVYGCITDMIFVGDAVDINQRREINKQVCEALPSAEDWPLLCCEMFSAVRAAMHLGDCQTDVIHFGSSYKGVEHEWNGWLQQFEALLEKMYWVTATVHLQTEYNGSHTFVWQAEEDLHCPGQNSGKLRCEWVREDSFS